MRRLATLLLGAVTLAGCYPTEPGVSADVEYLEVRAGGRTVCALTREGPTLCWGDNQFGQLGNGTLEPSLVPGPMALSPRFVDIATGNETCALDQTGAPLCWGVNRGRTDIKDGSLLTRPQAVLTQGRYVQVTTGCGLTDEGYASCWGDGVTTSFLPDHRLVDLDFGCGISAAHELLCSENRFVPAGEVPAVRQLAQGGDLSCLLTDDGSPRCWGRVSFFPELPDTSFGEFRSDSFALLSGERQYVSLAVGDRHGCGLDAGGFASCWGDNAHGQIGDGTTDPAMLHGVLRPTPVNGDLRFRSIAAGTDFTCGVTQDFQLYCWGANDRGQLGNGTTAPSLLPLPSAAPTASM